MTQKIILLCFVVAGMIRVQGCSDPHIEYLHGTVSDLQGTVILDLNDSEQLTISKDGPFQFQTLLVTGTAYGVTVSKQPVAQTCTIENASGLASFDDPEIKVICSAVTYSIGGNVTGLTGTLVLKNNDADPTTITTDGMYTFKTEVANGASYNVTISQQPTGQVCAFSGTHAGMATADAHNVDIICSVASHDIQAIFTGLTGTISLQFIYDDGSGDVTTFPNFSTDGTYKLQAAAPYGSTYDVTVDTNPSGEFCVVLDGSGTVTNSTATISVDCSPTKTIFVTDDISLAANLGSPSAYDSSCMSSTNYPGSGTYKALMVDSSTRVACTTANCSGGASEHIGWIISPTTYYVNLSGNLIGKSDSNGLLAITGSAVSASSLSPWTGISTDWTTGLNCLNWTSPILFDDGIFGLSSSASSAWYANSVGPCDSLLPVYCVEQ